MFILGQHGGMLSTGKTKIKIWKLSEVKSKWWEISFILLVNVGFIRTDVNKTNQTNQKEEKIFYPLHFIFLNPKTNP